MTNLHHLKNFSKYNVIYIDVDDTLIQTTLTLDRFSKFPIKEGVHPINGRWNDLEDIVLHYNDYLEVPLYDGVKKLLSLINKKVISAAPDISVSRENRTRSLLGLSYIDFFDNDEEKIDYLKKTITENDLIIDDKEKVLYNMKCDTLLVNNDLNKEGVSIKELVTFWEL